MSLNYWDFDDTIDAEAFAELQHQIKKELGNPAPRTCVERAASYYMTSV